MNIISSLEWRYATKKFDASKKLTSQQIDILKKAFNLTATSFGLQPIKLVVIENKKLQEKFVEPSFNQRQVADCSHLLVICIENDTTSEDINTYFDLEKKTRNISEDTVGAFRKQLLEMYKSWGLEKRQLSAKYQAYIALGNLITVCAVEQIDNCPMEGFIPSKIDEILNLKELNLQSILMLPVGYRAEDDLMNGQKKVRKQLNEVIIDIK
ncbi:NAD(P)H-dependent oxidoreductase [Lutibacter sp. TH_r2]|uniref:NAD(P)H-dependent oxidoreductase n=1 Tax=Lutibacter sp. TH_r2 TaxID=3082083 RepID=UPI0029552F5B|nr:NAD(P)H-dependent oxidoreductase [Lutibacter sp. TH_r2]MDV7185678.1 NAD(P)H-dependent oxidoreductase [Lutibacter sp. TH_r2]